MKNSTKLLRRLLLLSFFSGFIIGTATSQYCDPSVPSMVVDLTAAPNMSWVSPPVTRNGNCCGTSNPDRCLEFVITLHPLTIAVNFNIASGAIPPGALFYQIDCGPPTAVGAPICLVGTGPHTLTFCKPGNNINTFSITGYSSPIIGPDIALNAGCHGFLYANYFNESSVSWTSIGPGTPGLYDGLLSCTVGCDTTYITSVPGVPSYVDYLVCGMDVAGCDPNPICDTIRVNFISEVNVSLSAPQLALCAGMVTTITANATGGSAPYNYLWSTAEVTNFITAGPGVYYVDVTDTSGCHVATDTIVIASYPIPIVNAGPNQVVCDGVSVALNGSGGVSYVWNNGITDGTPFFQGIGTLTYTVIGTDANGCTAADQVDVTVNPLPVIGAGADQTICDGAAVALNGSGAVSYSWDNAALDGVPFIPAVGTITYTVIGTDANGCINTDQVDVTVNPLPIIDAGLDQQVCDGTTITVNGTGGVSYAWSNGITDGVPFTPVVGSYTYTVTGTDANGCINTDQVDVIANALPSVNAGADQALCVGGSVTLTGAGAISYVWNNGVLDGIPFTPTVGTLTYTVTGTDANGCINTDQVDVIVNPLPDVSAGADMTVCEGTAVTLNGSGTVSYSWDNGVTNGVAFTPAVGTITYTVTGTDGNGCVNTDQVDVTVNPLPIIDAGLDQQVCDGTTITVNGAGGVSYAWSNGITDGIPFTPVVGSYAYTVTGTDANGCFNMDQVDVLVYALPTINAGSDQQVCDGSFVTLNGSGGISYVWNNGVLDGIPFISSLGTTTYTVVGTDINGCSKNDQVDVVVIALPVISAGPDQQICDGDAVSLSGSGGTSYIWDNAVLEGVPFIPAVGTITYTVIGSDANGCNNTDQVDILVNALPVISAGQDQQLCDGINVILNGSGAVSYTWDNGVVDGVPFSALVGTTTYTVTGTDINGCLNTSQADVLAWPLPNIVGGTDQVVCDGFSVTLNGSGGISYVWNNGVLDGVPFIPSLGTTTYIVSGTDFNSCSNNDTVMVTVNPNPVVNAGPDQTDCITELITLSAIGSPNLFWDNGVLDGIPFSQAEGIVIYTVYDSLSTGCKAADMVQIEINPNPVVTAEDVEICEGEGLTLNGAGAFSYSWSGGIQDGIEFFPNQTGQYIVTGTNVFGCSSEGIATVTVNQAPMVNFNILDHSLTTTSSGTGFYNLSVGAVSFEWNFGDASGISTEFEPYHEFPNDEAGSYEITLTGYSAEGCPAQKVKYVYVTQDYTIYVPNAFTPDGNGTNDVFKPVMDGFDEDDYTLYIFNRWGELVFESHSMEVGWDGSYSQLDSRVQDGVFTWKVIAGIKDLGDTKIFVGHATLLK